MVRLAVLAAFLAAPGLVVGWWLLSRHPRGVGLAILVALAIAALAA